MAINNSVVPYKMKTPKEVKESIDKILHNLETHGRAITGDTRSAHTLTRQVKNWRDKNQIFIGIANTSPRYSNRKTVFVIPPEFRLVHKRHKICLIKKV